MVSKTNLINFLDEYERMEGFQCSTSKGATFKKIMNAKMYCNSDKTCIGFTSYEYENHYATVCKYTSRVFSSPKYRQLYVKKNRPGKIVRNKSGPSL